MSIRFRVALLVVIVVGARNLDARAQDAPVVPAAPPSAAQPEAAPAPAPIAQPEAAPAPAPLPVPVSAPEPTQVVASEVAPPEVETGFVLVLQTTGFFSSLDNGVFFGGRAKSGTIWGVGLSFGGDRLSGGATLFSQEQFPSGDSAWGFSIYPGAKFVLASASRGRLELVTDVDLGFTKYFATDHMGSSVSDGTGFWGHVGPGLRLWLTPALAISYTALVDLNWRTGRQGEIPGEVASTAVVDSGIPRQSDDFSVAFYGRFALIGVF